MRYKKEGEAKTDVFGYRWASINVNGKTFRVKIRKKSEWEKELENGLKSMSWN